MVKTRKIQVTLEEADYVRLAAIARRDNKKLAGVVRESIERYCLAPEAQKKKRAALDDLLALEPAPAPDDYGEWKQEYSGRKAKKER